MALRGRDGVADDGLRERRRVRDRRDRRRRPPRLRRLDERDGEADEDARQHLLRPGRVRRRGVLRRWPAHERL